MVKATTIKINPEVKKKLDTCRSNPNESYNDVIQRLIFLSKWTDDEGTLRDDVIKSIEKSRELYRKGYYVTESEAIKRLGLEDEFPDRV